MSQRNHLKRAVKIIWNKYSDEIREYQDWTWNLKNWTINFYVKPHYESVVAYKAKNGLTDWSDGIYLEQRKAKWEELV